MLYSTVVIGGYALGYTVNSQPGVMPYPGPEVVHVVMGTADVVLVVMGTAAITGNQYIWGNITT